VTFAETLMGLAILVAGFVPAIVGLLKLSQRTGRARRQLVLLTIVGLTVMVIAFAYWGYVIYT
jgi:uncharacterized membrane protein YidH (DUF202 family)